MVLLSLNLDTSASVILTISIMLFIAFLLTRITKRFKLPNVTAYLFAGILIGPHVLNLIPASVISGMEFLTDLALACRLWRGKIFETRRTAGKQYSNGDYYPV